MINVKLSKMNLIRMEVLRMPFVLLLLCLSSVFCFPSRPLNERSEALAWQAWLLVDDQNQTKQNQPEALMRRRITPKSVFIAPTFSPEKLPACADGYRSDPMGRCIQIIKIDEAAHLDFLLQKLNAQFGNFTEYEEVTENLPTPGPFQVNIPLEEIANPNSQYDHNPDIAIVVAPTNGNFDAKTGNNVKLNVKRTNQKNETPNSNPISENVEDETTTMETSTITEATTTIFETTTIFDQETTTFDETTETTTELPTTTDIMQAIFFLDPSKKIRKRNGTQPPEQADQSAIIGNRMKIRDNTTKRTTFIDPVLLAPLMEEDLTPSENTRHTANFVRFPASENLHHLPLSSSIQDHDRTTQNIKPSTQREFESLFQDYIQRRGADLRANERHIFGPFNQQHHTKLDPISRFKHQHGHDRLEISTTSDQIANHRNRDKHSNLWNLPINWSESSPQKPIVLKFLNRPGSIRMSNENLYRHRHNSEGIYREVSPEELSYIFGLKRRPRNVKR